MAGYRAKTAEERRKDMLKRRKRQDRAEKAGAAAMVGCVSFLVLVKLAFLALIAWGIFELVTWVISK